MLLTRKLMETPWFSREKATELRRFVRLQNGLLLRPGQPSRRWNQRPVHYELPAPRPNVLNLAAFPAPTQSTAVDVGSLFLIMQFWTSEIQEMKMFAKGRHQNTHLWRSYRSISTPSQFDGCLCFGCVQTPCIGTC